MTFTYSPLSDLGKLRLKLGDRTKGSGPRPDGANFTDEELGVFLDEEETVANAVAAACEVLATEWAGLADLEVGPRRESLSQVSQAYAERAKALRAGGGISAGVISLAFAQTDP